MNPKEPFKWRHFQSKIILLCVRWYLRYPLSYRHLEEMMGERGLLIDHTTGAMRFCEVLKPRTEIGYFGMRSQRNKPGFIENMAM